MAEQSCRLIVVTGPSGAGLPDIVARLMKGREDLSPVTPVTARKMKDGETDGQPFYFYDLEGWNALKESGDLLEATELAGNDYGTSRRLVREILASGKHVLLSVEPERAAQVRKNMPEAVCVYVEPSNPELLRERYAKTARNTFELTARMELAAEQRAFAGDCDFCVASDDPDTAVSELCGLIDSLSGTKQGAAE